MLFKICKYQHVKKGLDPSIKRRETYIDIYDDPYHEHRSKCTYFITQYT